MIEIREVKIKDWGKLKELLLRIIQEIPPVALELEPIVYESKEWLVRFPSGDSGHFLVVEENGKIIGFGYLAVPKFYKPVAYIGMAIAKERRREGLGSRLFYQLAEWAVAQKLQYIIADIWSWNLKSLKFFESLGFVEKSRFNDRFKGEEKEKVRLVKRV